MRNFLSHFHAWKEPYFMLELKKKLLWDAYLKYLIKILITQDFLKQSDEYRGVMPQENNLNYNLSICQLTSITFETFDPHKNISDYSVDDFEASVQTGCYTFAEEFFHSDMGQILFGKED